LDLRTSAAASELLPNYCGVFVDAPDGDRGSNGSVVLQFPLFLFQAVAGSFLRNREIGLSGAENKLRF
jgi:hypothetical protein